MCSIFHSLFYNRKTSVYLSIDGGTRTIHIDSDNFMQSQFKEILKMLQILSKMVIELYSYKMNIKFQINHVNEFTCFKRHKIVYLMY